MQVVVWRRGGGRHVEAREMWKSSDTKIKKKTWAVGKDVEKVKGTRRNEEGKGSKKGRNEC